MTPEQFEQAKREIAEKYFPCVGTKNDREYRKMEQDALVSDLNALLDKLMPTEEEVKEQADLLYSKEIFLEACEWFRSRMKGGEK